jgi:beta-phosphoglucomutase-like phosphatase (HAD superfamily)
MGSTRLREVLARIEQVQGSGRLPVAVFDLDSTLFSTGPRNWAILQEFMKAPGREGLARQTAALKPEDIGWNIHECLRKRGIGDTALWSELRRFWSDRFFTDAYVMHDRALPGAAAFVTACHSRGALIYYLTGRHVGGMEVGTVATLRSEGFPFWRGRCVLHLKPSFEMADTAFKDDAVADVRSYRGEVVASFENEPGNANMFLRAFPEALHFLLETVHSPNAEVGDPALIRSADFVLP